MNIKKFFTGRAIVITILFLVLGLFALNNYIYKEKQGEGATATEFTWKFEDASTLNLDGNPETDLFLEVTYSNGEVERKLIDTTPGSCNPLPDAEEDSVPGTENIQCYSAGLGDRYKITQTTEAYLVQKKTFEEALPNQNPSAYEYEIVAEFLVSVDN